MGPSGKTRSTRTRKSTRKKGLKKSLNTLKQQRKNTKNQEVVLTSTTTTTTTTSSTEDDFPKTEGIVFEAINDDKNSNVDVSISTTTTSNCSSGCSTPKGQRFRIPEISTCPPAPKKRRLDNQSPNNCAVKRSPIAFFAPPDLELFFHYALRGISV